MNKIIRLKQKLSRSKAFNRALQIFLWPVLWLKPLKHVMIEPTNSCNLSCLFCTQASSPRSKGTMSLENFEKIAAQLPPSVKEAQLHFAGESALNQNLPAMIETLRKRGVKTILSSNGTRPFEFYEKIINAGLDELIISFDGATKETYEQYRRGGNFEAVVQNIKNTATISGRRTRLIIQFIVMRHNESEIEAMKKLARDLGVDELWLKSASFNIGCSEILERDIIANAKNFLPQNPKYSRYEFKGGRLINKDKPLSCPWIFRTVILWNGDVTICCVDLDGQAVVGNILRGENLIKLWRSAKYNLVRKLVLRGELDICRKCSIGDNPVKEIIKYR